MNSVTLFGRLEKDPCLMGMPGRDVCEFWLRVPTKKERHALHVKIVTFGPLAVSCSERLATGEQVGVTGHLRSDEFPQQSSRRLFVHTVIGRQIDFVEPGRSQASPEPVTARGGGR